MDSFIINSELTLALEKKNLLMKTFKTDGIPYKRNIKTLFLKNSLKEVLFSITRMPPKIKNKPIVPW
jgi:hypothetical protein